ncbi:wall-associated receptor kinase 3 [Hordeum vulgare]|nr:wall-associated receptor kinase 3 [Hordeum vulgare]
MMAEHPVPEQVVLELARAVGSAEAQILSAGEATTERGQLGRLNPPAPGWNKRLRIEAATPSRPPYRNRISAFEKAFRSFAENPAENVIAPAIGPHCPPPPRNCLHPTICLQH